MRASAPIAIFAFNRPQHLRRMLGSLLACEGVDESRIFVFADGPRREAEHAAVDEARQTAVELLGDRAEYRFSEANKGLASSIIGGVGELVSEHGRVIVLEDDFVLAPRFLAYMNEALERFAEDENVYQVSGHMFEAPDFDHRAKALFLPLTTTWGWATWHRAWRHFDPVAAGWEQLLRDPSLRKRFNFGGCYDWASMMQRQMEGKRDSWGVRWYWSVFRRDGLVLFPPRSLVRNTGTDGSGTHGRGTMRRFDRNGGELASDPISMPEQVAAQPEDVEAVRRAIWRQNGGWIGYSVDCLKKTIRR
jgi:hypothetical protein